jgi:hypothetical protein
MVNINVVKNKNREIAQSETKEIPIIEVTNVDPQNVRTCTKHVSNPKEPV